MKRLEGGFLGSRPSWDYLTHRGLWTPEQQFAKNRNSLWPAFDPIPGLDPVLRYDFADISTITLSGTRITQIRDKGTRGWNLTSSTTGPIQATWTNNSLLCCDWGATTHGNYLRNTSSTSTTITEVYIVLDAAFSSTFPSYNGLITDTVDNTNDFNVTGSLGSTSFDSSEPANNFDAVYINGSTTNSYASVLPAINNPCLLRLKKVSDANVTLTDGFQIGNDRSNNSRGWYGLIGEVIAFPNVLSSANRSNVQTYLAKKWSLTLV